MGNGCNLILFACQTFQIKGDRVITQLLILFDPDIADPLSVQQCRRTYENKYSQGCLDDSHHLTPATILRQRCFLSTFFSFPKWDLGYSDHQPMRQLRDVANSRNRLPSVCKKQKSYFSTAIK
jgi:hypothetical protein